MSSIENILENEEDKEVIFSILGNDGHAQLSNIYNQLDKVIWYDDKKNWSRMPRWLAFQKLARKANASLKAILQTHKKHT